jgi:membrane-associated phospholipid phosphatase
MSEYRKGQVKADDHQPRVSAATRLAVILTVSAFHISCYLAVNALNSRRPEEAFRNLGTALDQNVPYLPWTSVFYYFGDFFVIVFAALVIWRMLRRPLRRAAFFYAGMILAGAILQLLFPGKAPWSDQLAAFQKAFHASLGLKPYACLPSMHVALSVFPALLSLHVWKSAAPKIIYVASAILITISTVTFKEHYLLDAVAGALLAAVFYWLWRWRLDPRPRPRCASFQERGG